MKVYVFVIEINGRREYFTGKTGVHGGPARSPFRADAFKFSSWGSALECAETHEDLRNSEEWKICPLVPRRAVTT